MDTRQYIRGSIGSVDELYHTGENIVTFKFGWAKCKSVREHGTDNKEKGHAGYKERGKPVKAILICKEKISRAYSDKQEPQ